jgi:DNA-binding NtrC family response regulator
MTARLRDLPIVRRFAPPEPAVPGPWTGPPLGRRVLVEEQDASLRSAMAEALREAGFQTAECPGPGSHGERRCPLVDGSGCDAVDRADAVLEVFVPTDAALNDVRRAIHAHAPDTPVVVMSPPGAAQRHPDLLAGASVSTEPLSRRGVLGAVDGALAGPPPADPDR